jgi:spore germination protein KC
MKRTLFMIMYVSLIFLLTGCWDEHELNESGFVQGVAVDLDRDGKILLTTQIYKPIVGGSTTGKAGTFLNIQTKGQSIEDAIRKVPIQLGRKAQYSHIRVILFGEPLAKTIPIGKVLDFFIRDHEMRLTTKTMITKGKASNYLEFHPSIEPSISQQFRTIQESAFRYNSMTTNMNILELAIQLKSKVNDADVTMVYLNDRKKVAVEGVALLKEGKKVGELSPSHTPYLNMLVNHYNSGVINVPCKSEKSVMESFEVTSLQTHITPKVKEGTVNARISVKIKGSATALTCTSMTTSKEVNLFQKSVEDVVKKGLRQTIDQLQKQKTDILGIGNELYRKHPDQWRGNWDERFAQIPFEIDVKAVVSNTGMEIGEPFSK